MNSKIVKMDTKIYNGVSIHNDDDVINVMSNGHETDLSSLDYVEFLCIEHPTYPVKLPKHVTILFVTVPVNISLIDFSDTEIKNLFIMHNPRVQHLSVFIEQYPPQQHRFKIPRVVGSMTTFIPLTYFDFSECSDISVMIIIGPDMLLNLPSSLPRHVAIIASYNFDFDFDWTVHNEILTKTETSVARKMDNVYAAGFVNLIQRSGKRYLFKNRSGE